MYKPPGFFIVHHHRGQDGACDTGELLSILNRRQINAGTLKLLNTSRKFREQCFRLAQHSFVRWKGSQKHQHVMEACKFQCIAKFAACHQGDQFAQACRIFVTNMRFALFELGQ